MEATIKLGVYDWTEFCSAQGYYPEDLPNDWRLSYFSNEFEAACICLSGDQRNILKSRISDEWFDDLPDCFALSFKIENTEDLELLARIREQSSANIDRVLIQNQDSQLLEAIDAYGLTSTEFESIWSPDQPNHQSSIALMPAKMNLRAFRDCIETWLGHQNDGDSELTLLIQAENLNYQDLNQIKTLIELMGY